MAFEGGESKSWHLYSLKTIPDNQIPPTQTYLRRR
jgi:hypothetical protein